MRLWIRARRQKISERLLAGSGRFPDAVPKSSGRWPRRKAHRNTAAEADVAQRAFPSRSVEDQNPLRFFCEGLALINSEMGLGRTSRQNLGEAKAASLNSPEVGHEICVRQAACAPQKRSTPQPRHSESVLWRTRWLCYLFFHWAPPSSGKTNRFARMSMIQPASTTRPNRCVGGKSDNTKMAKPAAKITSE